MLPAKDADGIDDNGQKYELAETTFWHCCQIGAERSHRDKPGPGFAVGSPHKMLTRPECDGEHLPALMASCFPASGPHGVTPTERTVETTE
jgi:hypothetical protein